jgi:hypothetical protein
MKKYLLGAVLAAGLAVALLPASASAYWTCRTTYRWDPCTCCYVPCTSCCWVPDCDPCDPYCDGGYYGSGGYYGGGDYNAYSFRRSGRHDFDRFDHHRLHRR